MDVATLARQLPRVGIEEKRAETYGQNGWILPLKNLQSSWKTPETRAGAFAYITRVPAVLAAICSSFKRR